MSEWYGCSSSRVRIYIAAIYSIFIYIYYLYIYNINIISIYLIIYINIIPFSPFLCNTSVLYVKNSIYIYCKLLYINVLRVFPSLSLYLCRLWELNTPPPRTPTTPTTPTLSLNFFIFFIFRRCHTQQCFTFYYFHYYFHHTSEIVYLPIYLRSATLLFPFCVVIRFSVKTRLERK